MKPFWPAVVLAGLVLASATSGLAQDSLEAAKRAELERIQAQAREHRQAATRLRGQEQKALVQLKRTERELNTTRKRLQALTQQRTLLAQRLRNLYKYGAGRELEFLLSTQSFAQLLSRWDFLVMVAEQDRVLLEDIENKKEAVEADRNRLELNLNEIQRVSKKTTKETDRLAGLRRSREQSVQAITTQREAYEAAAAELERTARDIRNLLAQLERKRQAETDRARSQGRNPQPYTGNFAQGQGRLEWPARGPIVGHIGQEHHPKWGTITMNNGIDIQVDIGTPVHAVAKGRVDYVSEDFGTYGQMIILNHGDGYYTLYGHLSSIAIAVGQEVQSGQTIAQSGDSGSLKGPILHFEVRKGSATLDPENWLK
jgi:septal ring factor EnvC (AmiA/AmiB activator)